MKTLVPIMCSMFVLSLCAAEPIPLEDSGSLPSSDATAVIFSADVATVAQPSKPSAVDGTKYTVTNETQPNAVQLSLRVQDKNNNVSFLVSIPLVVMGERLLDADVLNDTALYVRIGLEKRDVWRCVLVDIPDKKLIYVKNYVDAASLPVIIHK